MSSERTAVGSEPSLTELTRSVISCILALKAAGELVTLDRLDEIDLSQPLQSVKIGRIPGLPAGKLSIHVRPTTPMRQGTPPIPLTIQRRALEHDVDRALDHIEAARRRLALL